MAGYKGIIFAEGYNRPFAEFKEEFESTHVFKSIPHKERDSELKKAYKIATGGKSVSNTGKGKKTNPGKGK